MQKYKNQFIDLDFFGTRGNIQKCLRLNDIDSIGDGTHLGVFNMMGLFSFREWSVEKSIIFWMDFLNKIGVIPDAVTIHPNKYEWEKFYTKYSHLNIKIDDECVWSDGKIGGYCTEFYKNGVEIGNIVNPLENCIDVGFGLERLSIFKGEKFDNKELLLKNCVYEILKIGVSPSHTKHGYVLRRLIRICINNNIEIDHPFFLKERERLLRNIEKYNRLKIKFKDKTKNWWYETHGIDLDLI